MSKGCVPCFFFCYFIRRFLSSLDKCQTLNVHVRGYNSPVLSEVVFVVLSTNINCQDSIKVVLSLSPWNVHLPRHKAVQQL